MIKTIFLLATFFFVTFYGIAQSLEERFDEILKKEYPASEPGATALVSVDSEVVYRKAFGKANLELDVPMNTDMVFKIGSMTKQFTSVGILMLKEEGKLQLQDLISTYIENFPNGDNITIHHLLTHTSGISNNITVNPWNQLMLKKDFEPLEFIDYFKEEPKVSEPGEAYEYNNFGYIILGAIIENITEQSYADFLRINIFEPLGMNHTQYGSHSAIISNRAYGYEKRNVFVNAQYISMTQPYAAGSLMSTVDDLFLWQQALHAGEIIKKENLDLAFVNYQLNNGEKINYGYGWFIDEVQGVKTHEHGGGIPGYSSYLLHLPSENVFVTILSNGGVFPRKIAVEMAAIAIGKPYETPKSVATEYEKIKNWVGQYTFTDGTSRTIFLNEGFLYYILPNGTEIRMLPVSNSSFLLENTFTQVDFKMSEDKLVNMYTKNRSSEKVAIKEFTKHEEIDLPAKAMKKFVGEYQLFSDFSLTINLVNGQLQSTGTGQEALDIFPESPTRFFFKSIDAFIDFYLDASGNCSSLEITQDGRTYSGKRVK